MEIEYCTFFTRDFNAQKYFVGNKLSSVFDIATTLFKMKVFYHK